MDGRCGGRPANRCGPPLSARQVEVLDLVARDLSRAQIAGRLCISPFTVKVHLAAIHAKLDCSSTAGAVGVAYREGLLSLA